MTRANLLAVPADDYVSEGSDEYSILHDAVLHQTPDLWLDVAEVILNLDDVPARLSLSFDESTEEDASIDESWRVGHLTSEDHGAD